MAKKKAKKPQKSGGATAAQASDDKKKVEESVVEEEEIKRDDDLYISQNDVDVITNYIRTTNKSFQSLGNTLVEAFNGRCAVSLSQALFSLFDESTPDDRDEIIRRLNITYMLFRLPEIETELRVKPTKTMNDIHNHIFASFFFYMEESSFQYESVLARVIVCNKVSTIEKMTAPDFMTKADTMTDLVADHQAYKKWESENNAHWPIDLDDDISVTTVMRNLGWDRKEYEAGCSEAFYPLYHPVPTLLPPWLDIQHEEVLLMDEKHVDNLSANEARWKETVKVDPFGVKCDENRAKLLESLKKYETNVNEFQDDLLEKYTPEEVTLITREVTFIEPIDPSSSESGDSQDFDDDEEEPSFLTAQIVSADEKTKKLLEAYDNTLRKAIDAVIDGYPLNGTNMKIMLKFIEAAPTNSEYFLKLYSATKQEHKLKIMVRQNLKVIVPLMNRILVNEGLSTLNRYLTLFTDSAIIIHAQEAVLKILQELKDTKKLNERYRKVINEYVRTVMRDEEVRRTRRNLRVVAIVLIKLLNEGIILVEDLYNDMSEFALSCTEVREMTNLYTLMTQLRNKRDKRAAEVAKRVAEERRAIEEREALAKAGEAGPSPKAEEPGPSASGSS